MGDPHAAATLVPGPSAAPAHPAPVLYSPRGAAAQASDSVVVVSWNVHVGGGDIPRLVSDLRSGALTGVRDPAAFVILLQEAHRSGAGALRAGPDDDGQGLHHAPPSGERMDVVEVAEVLGLHLVYVPAMANGRPTPGDPEEDRGVAILSSHRLDDMQVLELPRERQRRVAIVGTVRGTRRDGTPWSLRVATTHLENRAPWRRVLDSFGAARARQARALVRGLGQDPVVLGGDLNTWGPGFLEPALGMLRRHFPDTPEADAATFSLAGIPRTLDHLLFRLPPGAAAGVEVADERYGSDHTPVLGVVALPTG